MKYNPLIHNRRSIRLKGYDYSQAGAYFITICTHQRQPLFGEVINGKMILNEMGQIAYNEWLKTPEIRPYVSLDVFTIMPNHMHGIIVINDNPAPDKGVSHTPVSNPPLSNTSEPDKGVCNTPTRVITLTINNLGSIIRAYAVINHRLPNL